MASTSTGPARAPRTEAEVRVDLAAAYRLAALNGWDDTVFTHLSASVPGEPGTNLINPFGLGFDEISACQLRAMAAAAAAGGRILVPDEAIATLTHRQWVGDGREWDGDVEWPALLRRLDRVSPGYRE
ncbi:MAG: class II aldolase/adducin family protein [Rubrivivax sp.]|nr:class II aldolase/adducin family protein [Rubrivivax sp.]